MRRETYFSSDWLMYRAAELFYLHGLAQKEISATLRISPVTVSRLIQKAKDSGVVRFSIQEPYAGMLDIAQQLKEKYGLQDAIITHFPNVRQGELTDIKQTVALEGAKYLQRQIKSEDVVGIAWGKTMFHLINYLNPCQRVNAAFVTMHGSIASCDYQLDVHTLTKRAAMALGGKQYSLYANGLLDSSEAVQRLEQEKRIQQVMGMFEHITISVSGIGSHCPEAMSPLAFAPYLSAEEYQTLKEKHVCGDIMLRFFDLDGQECDTTLKKRTVAIPLEIYQRIPQKILAVTGLYKAVPLHVALKNHYCDVLVADSQLARKVLEM